MQKMVSIKTQTHVLFLFTSVSSATFHHMATIFFDMPWNRLIFSGHIIGTAYAVPIIELRLAAQAFYREFLMELPIIYITGTASQPHKSAGKNDFRRLTTTMYLVVDIPIFQIGCYPSCCLSG